jgi:hypothetical protein
LNKPGWFWAIKRYKNSSDARQLIDQSNQAWKGIESGEGKAAGQNVRQLRLGGDESVLASDAWSVGHAPSGIPPWKVSSITHLVVYRDLFLIVYFDRKPGVNHDFSAEDSLVIQKSKELIDLRFPQKDN